MLRAIGFDLDNTLFDQGQHLRSYFAGAARWLQAETGVDALAAEQRFLTVWQRRTMAFPFLFDEVLLRLGVWDRQLVRHLVERYRAHRCPLSLYPGVDTALERLAAHHPLFLITDGHQPLQAFKVEELHLAPFFQVILYTHDLGPEAAKPSPKAFREAARRLGVATRSCVYVGDDPDRDVAGAHAAGMWTARVLTGPYRNRPCLPPADVTLSHLGDCTQLRRWICRPSVSCT